MLSFVALEPLVNRICREAIQRGEIETISYNLVASQLSAQGYSKQDLKPFKTDIKTHARSVLTAHEENESRQSIEPTPAPVTSSSSKDRHHSTSPLQSGPRQKKRTRVLDSEDDDDQTAVPSLSPPDLTERKSKLPAKHPSKEPKGVFKSKEFLDSEDNPRSSPPPQFSDHDERPRKSIKLADKPSKKKPKDASPPAKVKKVSTSKKSKAAKEDLSPNQVEIARLKGFIKACGVRLMAKETEDMSDNQTIKYLKAKLADLGMTGRLSMAKAKEVKAKRDLDREMSDLLATQPRGAANRVDANSGRGQRRATAEKAAATTRRRQPMIVPDDDDEEEAAIALPPEEETDSDDEDEDAVAFEAEQKKLDRQHHKRAGQFAKLFTKTFL